MKLAITIAPFFLGIEGRTSDTSTGQSILGGTEDSNCATACATLTSRFSSLAYDGASGDFRIWDGKVAASTPRCRIEPSSAEDVSEILGILKRTNCKFAVKSGGGSRTQGSINSDGGVVIDLARLNHITLSGDKKSASVGPGARWLDVYKVTDSGGVHVVGARHGGLGVGGFVLGGGFSTLTNSRGFGCDNVKSFEVVLPNTTIVTADVHTHPDLYRGLRGAGHSNFGIVTSFELETLVPKNPKGVWLSEKVYPWTSRFDLVKETTDVLSTGQNRDPDATYLIFFGIDKATDFQFVSTILFHNSHASNETWPDIYKPYESIAGVQPPSNNIVPLSALSKRIADTNAPDGLRNVWGWISYTPSVEMDEFMLELLGQAIDSIRDRPTLNVAMVMQPIPLTALRFSMSKNGGNAFGLKESDGPLNGVMLGFMYDSDEDDERISKLSRKTYEAAEEKARELGVHHPFRYINYAEEWQDIWSGFGAEENVKALREVQRRYDPEGVFTKGGLASGGFKLNDKIVGDKQGAMGYGAGGARRDEL